MADISCPYAKQTGVGGIFRCTKADKEAPPKTAKGKKKPQTQPQQQKAELPPCGHQRYCPQQKRCILTEQAATCPKRKE